MNKVPRWSQNDKRWSRIRLGDSPFFIGGHGCLLLDLAMATNTKPDKLVKMLEFTKDGLILWNKKNQKVLSKLGIDYVGRYRSWGEDDYNNVKKFAKKKDYVVLIEVRTHRGGSHWLLDWGWGWLNKPVCYDPWDGGITYNPYGLLGKYHSPMGWLLFSRNIL